MATKAIPWLLGRRYASLRGSRVLVGFISRLSVIGLSFGVAILITALSVMNGFDRELREKILALLPHVSVVTARDYPLLTEEEWQPYIDRLRQRDDISGVAPLVQEQGMVIANGRTRGVVVNGIKPEQEQEVSIIDRFMLEGSLDELQAGEYDIIIGAQLADDLNLSVGDELNLVSTEVPLTILGGFPRRKNFRITGIFQVGSQFDSSLLYAHMDDVRALYRLGNGVQGLRIQLEDLFAVNQAGRNLGDLLPPSSRFSYWTYEFGGIYQNIQLSKNMVSLLLFLLVAVAAFNVVVSLFMIVRDKQGDIAILRTMGTGVKTIRNIFIVQGALIGLIGTGIGLVIGVVLSLTVTDLVAGLEKMLGIQFLSAEIYPVNYLPSQLQLGDTLLVCGVSILLSILAAIYPAFRAARTQPAEVLRHE